MGNVCEAHTQANNTFCLQPSPFKWYMGIHVPMERWFHHLCFRLQLWSHLNGPMTSPSTSPRAGVPAPPQSLEEIFSRLDTNHDDAIDRDELKTGLKGLGIGFSEVCSLSTCVSIQTAIIGALMQTFSSCCGSCRCRHAFSMFRAQKKIDEMFRIADLDHNGAISVSEFTKFFGTLPKLLQVSSSSIEQRANPDATDSFLHTGDLPKVRDVSLCRPCPQKELRVRHEPAALSREFSGRRSRLVNGQDSVTILAT